MGNFQELEMNVMSKELNGVWGLLLPPSGGR